MERAGTVAEECMVEERTRLENYLEVLRTLRSRKNEPANLMFKSNLSLDSLKEILNSLTEQNMISVNYDNNRIIYDITERGRQVLGYFKKVQNLLTLSGSVIHRSKDGSPLEDRSCRHLRMPEIVVVNIIRYYFYGLG